MDNSDKLLKKFIGENYDKITKIFNSRRIMKKKILSIIGIFVLLFSLTGCIKFNATMEIKEDKSMDFSIIYAMNKQVLEMSEEQQELLDEKDRQEMINKGFTVDDYEDTDNKGFILTKKISNIDDYSSETDIEYSLSGIFEESGSDKIFKIIKGTDKNRYIANFKFDSNDSNLNDGETTSDNSNSNVNVDSNITTDDSNSNAEMEGDMGDLSKMTEAMSSTLDLKFIVKLPYTSISDNATEKSEDGHTLTWKLDANQVDNINFEFELNNKTPNAGSTGNTNSGKSLFGMDSSMIIAIISLVVGVISLVIALITASNKKKKLES